MGTEAMAGTVESQQEGGPREGAQASSMTARIVEAVVRRARTAMIDAGYETDTDTTDAAPDPASTSSKPTLRKEPTRDH